MTCVVKELEFFSPSMKQQQTKREKLRPGFLFHLHNSWFSHGCRVQHVHLLAGSVSVCVCLDISSLLYRSVDSESGEFYYFNFATGETQWEHPLDEVYRQKVRLTDISIIITFCFSLLVLCKERQTENWYLIFKIHIHSKTCKAFYLYLC